MTLKDLLIQRQDKIVERWFNLIVTTYPPETARFLKREKDRFSNPVGNTTLQGLRNIYEELLENNTAKLPEALDSIIRIRSVQDFTASEAVAFTFRLKDIIRKELAGKMREGRPADAQSRLHEELHAFETRIDELSLLAFNIYMKCREKLYEIQTNEIKKRSRKAFEHAVLKIHQ